MKKLPLLLSLLLIFSIASCNSDDDVATANTPKRVSKIEKFESGNLRFVRTMTYNSSNKIQSIITNTFNPTNLTQTISVNYSGSSISTIQFVTNYEDPNIVDTDNLYDVTYNANTIVLTRGDYEVEITHSDGYIDSVKTQYISQPGALVTYLIRDVNQNLQYIERDENITSSFSDFDSDKQEAQYDNILLADLWFKYYAAIFNLKITKNNPQKSTGVTYGEREVNYEYDAQGYIINANILNLNDSFITTYEQ